MSLVNLNHKLSLNPAFIQSVQCKEDRSIVAIKMSDGAEHELRPEHKENVYEAYDRIVERIKVGIVQ